jgi:CelD/BcsL family acetyltransferase involved in cellulose biosynthesis
MRVRVLTTTPEVKAITPAWTGLIERYAASVPFIHPDWVLSWWQARQSEGLEWRCYAGWGEDGRLGGVVPLVRYPDGVVRFAGHDLHDVATAVVSDQLRERLWQLVIGSLRADGGAVALDLPTLAADDMTAVSGCVPGGELRVYDVDPGARIVFPAGWDAHLASLPASRRKSMRAERRALERDHGPAVFDVVDGSGVLGAVDYLWALRERSWRVRGRYEELAEHVRGSRLREFLSGLAARCAGSGLVAVGRLSVAGQVIGSALLLRGGSSAWYAMCAFAPEFSRYGPGRMLLAECARDAAESGMTCLELGRGVEDYKFALGAARYELPCVRLDLRQ